MVEGEGDGARAGRAFKPPVENVVALPRRGGSYVGVTRSSPSPTLPVQLSGAGSRRGSDTSERGERSGARLPVGRSGQDQPECAPLQPREAASSTVVLGHAQANCPPSQIIPRQQRATLPEQQWISNRGFRDILRGASIFDDDPFPWERPPVPLLAAPSTTAQETQRMGWALGAPAAPSRRSGIAEAQQNSGSGESPLFITELEPRLGSPEIQGVTSSLVYPANSGGFLTSRAPIGGALARSSSNPLLRGLGGSFQERRSWRVGGAVSSNTALRTSLDDVIELPPDQLDRWLADWAGVPAHSSSLALGHRKASLDDHDFEDHELELALKQHRMHRRGHDPDNRTGVRGHGRGALSPLGSLPVAFRLAVM